MITLFCLSPLSSIFWVSPQPWHYLSYPKMKSHQIERNFSNALHSVMPPRVCILSSSFLESFMTCFPCPPPSNSISGALLLSCPHFVLENKFPIYFAVLNVSRFSLSPTCSIKPSLTIPTCGVLESSPKETEFGVTWIWIQILNMPLVILYKFFNLLFPYL